MEKIIVEVPEELARKARMMRIELSLLAAKALKDRIDELEEIAEFERIVSKSKATEKDVEEIVNEIEEGMERHYSQY